MSKIKTQIIKLYLCTTFESLPLGGASWVALLAIRGYSIAEIGVIEAIFHCVACICLLICFFNCYDNTITSYGKAAEHYLKQSNIFWSINILRRTACLGSRDFLYFLFCFSVILAFSRAEGESLEYSVVYA